MASYIQDIPPGNGVVVQKLVPNSASGIMFNVPNPESDIDPTRSVADSQRAFTEFRKLRDLSSEVIP